MPVHISSICMRPLPHLSNPLTAGNSDLTPRISHGHIELCVWPFTNTSWHPLASFLIQNVWFSSIFAQMLPPGRGHPWPPSWSCRLAPTINLSSFFPCLIFVHDTQQSLTRWMTHWIFPLVHPGNVRSKKAGIVVCSVYSFMSRI